MIDISDDAKAEIAEVVMEHMIAGLDKDENIRLGEGFFAAFRQVVRARLKIQIELD